MDKAAVLTAEELKLLAAQGFEDPQFFMKTFLHEWFPGRVPWVHRGLLAILLRKADWILKYPDWQKIVAQFTYKADASDEKSADLPIFTVNYDTQGRPVSVNMDVSKFTQVRLPRGFSKTTICNAAVIIAVCYRMHKVIGYIGETATHAEIQLSNVKAQLENNQLLTAVFGEFKPDTRGECVWRSDMIETTSGITLFARGRGGQIRGFNHKGVRPGMLVVDDLEDEESVQEETQRKKTKRWAYRAMMPALDPFNPNASLIAVGTILHREAILKVWEYDPRFTTISFGALDKNGDELWAENMTKAKLEELKTAYANAGELAGFYMEYHNVLRSDDTAKFKAENFIYAVPFKPLRTAIAIDPAISKNSNAAKCALAAVGMEEGGSIYVLDIHMELGMSPRKQIDMFFDYQARFKSQYNGVESIAYQAALIHLMREEMFRKKQYFIITPLTHHNRKEERVEGILQPRYANGYIRHARRFAELETQLLDWPNGLKDGPDVLSMAVALLDPTAAEAGTQDNNKTVAEDEYQSLNKVFKGNWRNPRI